jgi:hypothetical protein
MIDIEKYCIENSLRCKTVPIQSGIQYHITDGKFKSIVNVFNTGTLTLQGKIHTLHAKLKAELYSI